MNCDFDDSLKCRNCGYVARRAGTRRQCGIHGPEPLEKLSHYAQAVTRWTLAGLPKRSAEQIAALHAICQACDRYDGGACKVCGCAVSESPIPLVNKLAMATEVCPLGKWPADAPAVAKAAAGV